MTRSATVTVLDDIGRERLRQMTDEGWTTRHDDAHDKGQMARAAGCYAIAAGMSDDQRETYAVGDPHTGLHWHRTVLLTRWWPWSMGWWKPKDRRRDLIRAGALIVAEIERLDRLMYFQEPPAAADEKKAAPAASTFGEHLKEEMHARGWKKRDLAKRLGWSRRSVKALLADEMTADEITIRELAKAFGVSRDFLIGIQGVYTVGP